jgi:hypothetical protein
LNDLVPRYLPAIPIDPLDPDGDPLRYRLNGDKCVVYSVGPNRVDDGGTLPGNEDPLELPKSGDLWLEEHFRRMDEVMQQSGSGGTNAVKRPAPAPTSNPFE